MLLRATLVLFLAAGAIASFFSQRGFFAHSPGEGGRWVIDAVKPYAAPQSVIVSDWLDATSLAYGAYVNGSLSGRIIVSDDEPRIPVYRQWAAHRRVFLLVDPRQTRAIGGARDYATLDDYHELFLVTPP